MNLPKHEIFSSQYFRTICELAKKERKEMYLVGGFLRDLVIGREKIDFDLDFSVSRGAIAFGRKVAGALKAGFVVLDRVHGCSRVVVKDKAQGRLLTFDFVDFRAEDFKGDLRLRDFTVNTLAAPIPLGQEIIDRCGAADDIRARIIRVVDKSAFDEDPLRILRAFSLEAMFGMSIEPRTMRLIRSKRKGLAEVAGERLRDELFKILDAPDSWRLLNRMDKEGILELVIPQVRVMHNVKQGGYHHLDVWGHSLETVKKLEELLLKVGGDPDLAAYLDQPLCVGRKRRQVIKLAALLHDIGKPQAHEIKAGKTMFHGHERIGRVICTSVTERLKLATCEKEMLDTIIFWHLRPGYLADNKVLTPRAVFRYFRDTGREAASVLLVSIADQRATRGPMASAASRRRHEKVSFGLLERYFASKKEEPLVRLINGTDLIRKLKLKPGPIFSKILTEVEETQAEGKIKTKQEALTLARRVAAQEALKKESVQEPKRSKVKRTTPVAEHKPR